MRVYDEEFKEGVIKLYCELGNKADSDQLGTPETMLLYTWRSWLKQHGEREAEISVWILRQQKLSQCEKDLFDSKTR